MPCIILTKLSGGLFADTKLTLKFVQYREPEIPLLSPLNASNRSTLCAWPIMISPEMIQKNQEVYRLSNIAETNGIEQFNMYSLTYSLF